jgi:hypothetical protein
MLVVKTRCGSSFAQYKDWWLWVPDRASLVRDDVVFPDSNFKQLTEHTFVIAGLDPAIHPLARKLL